MIHVVTLARLGRAAMATAIVGDDAESLVEEEQHLRIPIVGRQGPPMGKHNRLTTTPILVVNRHSVFGCNRIAHAHAQIAPVGKFARSGF